MVTPETDKDGWQYAKDFRSQTWSTQPTSTKWKPVEVRRRRWLHSSEWGKYKPTNQRGRSASPGMDSHKVTRSSSTPATHNSTSLTLIPQIRNSTPPPQHSRPTSPSPGPSHSPSRSPPRTNSPTQLSISRINENRTPSPSSGAAFKVGPHLEVVILQAVELQMPSDIMDPPTFQVRMRANGTDHWVSSSYVRGLNPSWNERVVVPVPQGIGWLEVTLHYVDKKNTVQFMGQGAIKRLERLPRNLPSLTAVPLLHFDPLKQTWVAPVKNSIIALHVTPRELGEPVENRSPSRSAVQVTVLRAEVVNTKEPFVVLRSGDARVQTRTAGPNWNETLRLPYSGPNLRVEVTDGNTGQSIGVGHCDLSSIGNQSSNVVVPITHNGNSAGSVKLSILNPNVTPASPTSPRQDEPLLLRVLLQKSVLQSCDESTSVYIRMVVESNVVATRIQQANGNHVLEWDEEHHMKPAGTKSLPHPLYVELNINGQAYYSLVDLKGLYYQCPVDMTVDITPAGTIHLQLEAVNFGPIRIPEKPKTPVVLSVRVLEGNGLSDGSHYITLRVSKQEDPWVRTQTVKGSHPSWMEDLVLYPSDLTGLLEVKIREDTGFSAGFGLVQLEKLNIDDPATFRVPLQHRSQNGRLLAPENVYVDLLLCLTKNTNILPNSTSPRRSPLGLPAIPFPISPGSSPSKPRPVVSFYIKEANDLIIPNTTTRATDICSASVRFGPQESSTSSRPYFAPKVVWNEPIDINFPPLGGPEGVIQVTSNQKTIGQATLDISEVRPSSWDQELILPLKLGDTQTGRIIIVPSLSPGVDIIEWSNKQKQKKNKSPPSSPVMRVNHPLVVPVPQPLTTSTKSIEPEISPRTKGSLQVLLEKGSGMPDEIIYIALSAGPSKFSSSPQKGPSPYWNQKFQFNIPLDSRFRPISTLDIEGFAERNISIGRHDIDLTNLGFNTPLHISLEMKSGRLHVTLLATDFGLTRYKEYQSPEKQPNTVLGTQYLPEYSHSSLQSPVPVARPPHSTALLSASPNQQMRTSPPMINSNKYERPLSPSPAILSSNSTSSINSVPLPSNKSDQRYPTPPSGPILSYISSDTSPNQRYSSIPSSSTNNTASTINGRYPTPPSGPILHSNQSTLGPSSSSTYINPSYQPHSTPPTSTIPLPSTVNNHRYPSPNNNAIPLPNSELRNEKYASPSSISSVGPTSTYTPNGKRPPNDPTYIPNQSYNHSMSHSSDLPSTWNDTRSPSPTHFRPSSPLALSNWDNKRAQLMAIQELEHHARQELFEKQSERFAIIQQKREESSPKGLLLVNVIKAVNLISSSDNTEPLEALVWIKIEGMEKVSTLSKLNQHGTIEWNQLFKLYVPTRRTTSHWEVAQTMTVSVCDARRNGLQLGQAEIPLNSLFKGVTRDVTVEFRTSSSPQSGHLAMQLTAQDFGASWKGRGLNTTLELPPTFSPRSSGAPKLRPTLGLELKLVETSNGSSLIAVHSIFPGGPGEEAGVLPNDILLSWDDHPLSSRQVFAQKLKEAAIGSVIYLEIRRAGLNLRKPITVGGTCKPRTEPRPLHPLRY